MNKISWKIRPCSEIYYLLYKLEYLIFQKYYSSAYQANKLEHFCTIGPTMFLNMDKKQFSEIQARLFPKFGMVAVFTGTVALTAYNTLHPSTGIIFLPFPAMRSSCKPKILFTRSLLQKKTNLFQIDQIIYHEIDCRMLCFSLFAI